MAHRRGSRTRTRARVVHRDGTLRKQADHVATEEPLEIRLVAGGDRRTVAVTMRTPGADFELATGFLYSEGILRTAEQVRRITYCTGQEVDDAQLYNIVNVELAELALPDLRGLERHFYTTSACGVCGKSNLDALELRGCRPLPAGPEVDAEVLYELPQRLRDAQRLFDSTGGLHAAALFTAAGELISLREDVGRHNALDKLVGWALLEGRLPLTGQIVVVSGRSSFEIMQKALVAGVPMVCAVSAPSSLAVDVGRQFGMTLVGFLRAGRFNIYSGEDRIRTPDLVLASLPPRDHKNAVDNLQRR